MPIFKRHKSEQTTAPKTYTTPSGSAPAVYVDLLQQEHTLIAGTTGSGKSCAINGIIYTALYKSPLHTRFILIDPKRTELVMYRNLPHTIAYAQKPAEALELLKNALDEIDARYNRAAAKGLKKSDEADIYIVIDELSYLISFDSKTAKILGDITMIGRAANVHLIAATQCPNRKTLSAELEGNCTTRLGLRCRNKIESRQIIGDNSAVALPRYGYAYYQAPQYTTLQLVKIPYYTDDILLERVQFWEKQK